MAKALALLAALKAKGVAKLIHRQGIANAVARAARAGSTSAGSTSAGSPPPQPYPSWLVGGAVPRVHW